MLAELSPLALRTNGGNFGLSIYKAPTVYPFVHVREQALHPKHLE